jgi:hypothetical protein
MTTNELDSNLKELKLTTQLINELTKEMNDLSNINMRFKSLYNERKKYLLEQSTLSAEINKAINTKKIK